MSFIVDALVGKVIDDALVDFEITYLMLSDGTQVTIQALVVVEPKQSRQSQEIPVR